MTEGRSRKNVAEAACLGCRKRRTRCVPGAEPGEPCEYCGKNGVECVYSNPQRKRESVKELRERLIRYEELLGPEAGRMVESETRDSLPRPSSPPLEVALTSPSSATSSQSRSTSRRPPTAGTSGTQLARATPSLAQHDDAADDGFSILLTSTSSSARNHAQIVPPPPKRARLTPEVTSARLRSTTLSNTSNKSTDFPALVMPAARASPHHPSPSHAVIPLASGPNGASDK